MISYVRKASIEVAPLGAEAILYDPDSKRFFQLNATAACVWESLQQPRTAAELTVAIRDRFDVSSASHVETDVAEALRRLVDLEMVDATPDSRA